MGERNAAGDFIREFGSFDSADGVKGGLSYGATDEHGYEAVEDKCHIHDWHATILHLLGLDHEQLTYRYAGREFRVTDVHGNAAKKVLACARSSLQVEG